MVRLFVLLIAALAVTSCARSESTPAQPQAVTTHALDSPSHLLLLVELSPSGLKLLSSRRVDQPLPRLRVPEKYDWHLSLRDADGNALYDVDVPPQNQLRGEFAGDDGRIEAHHLLKPTSVFALRVPNVSGTLSLSALRKSLSPEDPRSVGAGDTVEVGTIAINAEAAK